MKQKKIIFTWGGTWWHITPILSLYNYLSETLAPQAMWLGERDSLEQKAAQKAGIEFHDISAGKIRRYFDWRNFYEPLKNLTGICESIYYILRYKGNIVFSKWGFVSVPVVIAAFFLWKKIYIHESDSHMWLANKITSIFAKQVFTSFPLSTKKKYIHSGHIMNPEMLDAVQSMSKDENEHLNILVIAGSQGSQNIFESLLHILPDCGDIIFHIVLGTNSDENLKAKFLKFPNVKSYHYISQRELAKLYIKADIAITRGSSTLWELFYFGIHSIIIPLRSTGWDHQMKNAEYFHKNYGSDILEESDELSLEIFRKLQKYKSLRKKDLNLEGYLDGVKAVSEVLQ